MVSTSSIIEGVNTQAEQVVVWSNKNGSCKFDYLLIGTSLAVQVVCSSILWERCICWKNLLYKKITTLEIDFPEEVVESLDSANPGVEINEEQNDRIKEYESFMIKL